MKKNIFSLFLLTSMCMLLSGCLSMKPPYSPPGQSLSDSFTKNEVIDQLSLAFPGLTIYNISSTKISGVSNDGSWRETWYIGSEGKEIPVLINFYKDKNAGGFSKTTFKCKIRDEN